MRRPSGMNRGIMHSSCGRKDLDRNRELSCLEIRTRDREFIPALDADASQKRLAWYRAAIEPQSRRTEWDVTF